MQPFQAFLLLFLSIHGTLVRNTWLYLHALISHFFCSVSAFATTSWDRPRWPGRTIESGNKNADTERVWDRFFFFLELVLTWCMNSSWLWHIFVYAWSFFYSDVFHPQCLVSLSSYHMLMLKIIFQCPSLCHHVKRSHITAARKVH